MNTSRRDFIKKLGLGAAVFSLPGCTRFIKNTTEPSGMQQPLSEKPNILFICTDYQSGEDGPSLGTPFLDMPALDRLCTNGIVFERHYSTAPVCMPERYTWITGQYPHTHGKWGNGGGWVKEGTPLLTEELGRHGYYTLGIGKMHFSPWDRQAGFSRRITADRKANIDWDAKHQDDYAQFLAGHGITRWDYLKLSYESETPHVYDWPFPEECHIDHFVGSQAARVLENGELDNKGPWFMWVSFNGPHNPWDPPKKYSEPYMQMDLPEPRTYPGELEEQSLMHTGARYGYTKEVADHIDRYPEREKDYIKRLRAAHYGNLTLIDRQVEKILAALEAKGQLENTVIIYSADHGGMIGDHGCFHKGFIYERSANVPFVVHCPARYKPCRTQALCGGVDLMPTILSLAGAPVPVAVEGTDLTPLFSRDTEAISDQTIIEIGGNIGVVTDRWKLFVHRNGEGELYDFTNDQDELKNLYNDPAYTGIRTGLEQRLLTFNPDFEEKLRVMLPDLPVFEHEYRFSRGAVLRQAKEPYPPPQAGKTIQVNAVIGPEGDTNPDGAFFVCEEHIRSWPGMKPQNGYALYIHDGKPAVGIRNWHEDTVYTADSPLPEGESEINFTLKPDGALTLAVNGSTVIDEKAPGALPVRPGRQELLAPNIHVGAGHKWGTPIGEYDHKADFTGIIKKVVLRLDT